MRVTLRSACLCATALGCLAFSAQATPPIAVLIAQNPSAAQNLVAGVLRQNGYQVRTLNFDEALAPEAFDSATLMALPDATRLPVALHKPVEAYLHRGGHLLALGLPGWNEPLLKVDENWLSEDDYTRATAWVPANPLLDMARLDTNQWKRSTDPQAGAAEYRIEMEGPNAALHATISNLTSWDTFVSPNFVDAFAPDETITVFCAKGGPRTTSLAVEWEEKDGSRWIATVPLTSEWRRYELPPSAFKFWPSASHRGGAGDHMRPGNALRFSVGLAFSHTGTVGGRHEYWFGNLGAAAEKDAPLASLSAEAEIDGLYPAYKTFAVNDAASLKGFGSSFAVKPTQSLRSVHPRPSGSGFGKQRKTRFISLLEARSSSGAWRGVTGAMYVHMDARFRRGVWALFSAPTAAMIADSRYRKGLAQTVRRMQGPFLAEGGTDWFTYFPGQTMKLGAGTTGPAPGCTATVLLKDSQTGKVNWRKSWAASEKPKVFTWKPPANAKGPWTALTTLSRGGEVLDTLSHPVHIYTQPAKPSFLQAREGRFLINGKPFKVHGVNYMPSSGVARDIPQDNSEFEFWLGSAGYDSAIVARDLDNVKRIDLNAVSIFVYANSVDSGNLLDILRLCRERGLKADVSLRPGTPMDFQWDSIKPLITKYRLKDDDTVIGYDLAWEPFFGGDSERAKYDDLWNAWITKHYGTTNNAIERWAFAPDRNQAGLRGPTGQQLTQDGPWLRYVLDYRQFVDELVGERYRAARKLVRSVDPNHLVSFRMTETSNPTYNWDANLPYDFRGLGNAVDFFAPEGYGRMGEWEHTKAGWFEVEYARAVNPALPVIWKEAGRSAWQAGLADAPAERLKEQGEVIENFYRMLIASGSNGVYWWWYPGGYRTGEASDYGIINPDGTDRAATRVIRANTKAFLASPAPVKANATVSLDLTRHSTGLYGAYNDVKDRFWELVGQGRNPRVVIQRPD